METAKEIFAPSWKRVIAAVAVAAFAHLFITVSQFREFASSDLSGVQDFWLTNLINGLPYLETENTFLKFLTFFAVSYLLVWAISRMVDLSGNLQLLFVKLFRKS
jgi:hypothetical protein